MPRYYDSHDGKTAGLSFTVMLAAYLFTMSPTVTMEQSGALVVAADHWGIGKVPGFPVWHILGNFFTRIFSFVKYQGHPNPAWATGAMSALFGAMTCGFVALLVSRVSRSLFSRHDDASIRPITTAAAIAASLLFGFSPTMWAQSVITETHALTNFFAAMFLAVLLNWIHTENDRGDLPVAFLFGLAFSVSQLLWLFAPVVLLAAALISRRKFAEMSCAMLAVFITFAIFARTGSFLVAGLFLLFCLVISLALLMVPAIRRGAGFFMLIMAGLLPYAYLPIAASFNPPMNMGSAYTWEGFMHVLDRGQFEKITPTNPFTDFDRLSAELSWLADATSYQFMLPMALIGIIPLVLWFILRSARKELALVSASLVSFAVFTAMGHDHPPLDIQTRMIVIRNYLPVFMIWSIFIGCGMVLLYDLASQRRIWPKRTGPKE